MQKMETSAMSAHLENGGHNQFSDDEQLAALGKTAELRRIYGFWSLCGYQIMMMASWSCIVVLFATIFDLGGPVGLIYGTLIVMIFQTLLMASLAELCSIWPTAGGQQFYSQSLAPPRIKRFISYVVGWAVLLGEIATGAGCATNNAAIISSFVTLVYPNLQWTTWMTFLAYLAMIIIPFIINLPVKILPGLNSFGGAWVIAGGITWAVVFLALGSKHDAKFVFTQFINNSGYSSNFWVFIMSFYNPMYALYGTDGILHLVEETVNPAHNAPRAMVWSMIVCGLMTFVSALVFMFTAGKYESYLEYPEPFLNWFIDTCSSFWGGGMFAVVWYVVANTLIVVGTNTTSSRLTWSMARDHAFPYSSYLAHVSVKLKIPYRAMVGVFVVEVMIGLVIFGGDLAFEAIISGAGVSLQLGYMIPVALLLWKGRSTLPSKRGFHLGIFGWTINFVSVTWSLLVIVIFLCPLYVPVNQDNIANMNWAVVIVGGEMVAVVVIWFFHARHYYIKDEERLDSEVSVDS